MAKKLEKSKSASLQKSDLLSDSIYVQLRSKIISGEWPIAMRLNEKQIATDLFVSRTPVHRALEALYAEGLLDYSKNWGYFIKAVSRRDIEEIFKIRTALETLAACEAAVKMTEDDFAELDRINEAALAACRGNCNEFEELYALSGTFNAKINQFCSMPRLHLLQEALREYLLHFRTLSFEQKSRRRELAVQEHQGIVRAMRTGDENLIKAKVREHLQHAQEYILSYLPAEAENETERH